jgi:hypothetical protein
MTPEAIDAQIRELEEKLRRRPSETLQAIQHIHDARDRDVSAIEERKRKDMDARRLESENEVKIRETETQSAENAEHQREANDMRLIEQEIRNLKQSSDRTSQPV